MKTPRIDDFGAGCFGLVLVGVVSVPAIVLFVGWLT